jgi:hypothetical protein
MNELVIILNSTPTTIKGMVNFAFFKTVGRTKCGETLLLAC